MNYFIKLQILTIVFITQSFSQLPNLGAYIYETSISGTSSGGEMSTQFQIAHSDIIVGAGIVASGPYMCAEGKLLTALDCMLIPGSINLEKINKVVLENFHKHTIDDLQNLEQQKIYIYSGTKDNIVKQSIVKKLEEQYLQLGVDPSNIKTEYDIPSQHAWITNNYGNKCQYLGEPFMNNCDFYLGFEILQHIYQDLKDPVPQIEENLIEFDQKPYNESKSSMNSNGYVYIPSNCQKIGSQCRIHVSLHGCLTSISFIGEKYVKNSGLNEIGEANDIIILYPQLKASIVDPINPQGCWDWYGYSDPTLAFGSVKYATKEGKQIKAIYNMLKDLSSNPENLDIN